MKNLVSWMNKTCILHLGAHKTGSTFIQSSFDSNKIFYESHNWIYPVFRRADDKLIANHSRPLGIIFRDQTMGPRKINSNIDKNRKEQFLKQLISACEQCKNLILSGEDMSIWSKAELERLVKFLSEYYSKIIPVIFIRAPYGFYCSALQQKVKGGISIKLLDPIAGEINTEHTDLWQSKRIIRLRSLFGDNLEIYNFREAVSESNGLFNFFLERLSLPKPTELNTNINNNKSMTNKWVRLQALINYNYESMSVKDRPLLRHDIKFESDAKFLLSNQELCLINSQLDIERKSLNDLVGNSFTLENIKTSPNLMVNDWVEMASKLCIPKNFKRFSIY